MRFSSFQSILYCSLLCFLHIFESLALVCLDLIYVFTMFDEGRWCLGWFMRHRDGGCGEGWSEIRIGIFWFQWYFLVFFHDKNILVSMVFPSFWSEIRILWCQWYFLFLVRNKNILVSLVFSIFWPEIRLNRGKSESRLTKVPLDKTMLWSRVERGVDNLIWPPDGDIALLGSPLTRQGTQIIHPI